MNNFFTAAQIAAVLGRATRSIRRQLEAIAPASTKIVAGNEASVWTLSQLPEILRTQIEDTARRANCRNAEGLLNAPRQRWKIGLPMDEIADEQIQEATKLREALRPWLISQHNSDLSRQDMESGGVEEYRRIFGHTITTRYWWELFSRTVKRDNGFEEWNRLEIYLPDRLKQKETAATIISEALATNFYELENFIQDCSNPHAPNENECVALWTLALEKFSLLARSGDSEKSAARRVREFLFARAPFLAESRPALFQAFKRKLKRWQRGKPETLKDARAKNGIRSNYPSKDIRMVRHSAVLKNGKRIDAAWREEYAKLSEYTRQLHAQTWKCPRPFYRLVNREKVDALFDRLQGKRFLRKRIGGVTRDAENVPSMARWSVDDMTSNIEIVIQNADGTISLVQPQIIAVMDFASRKWVGWSIAPIKSPTAELVCAAVLDGFQRHGVPHELWVENGFVFGKSLNVNGKEDEQGRSVVAGLGQYGCSIHHFEKMNPTSKAELEKSFDLVQRKMERHPGYAGRRQMLDASDNFKLEQRLIRSGKMPWKKFRYSYPEFVRVMHKLVEEYNATPQHGLLRGLSPNEAYEILLDKTNPPIQLNNELRWLFANERYRVQVKAGGVAFTHYGKPIKVRGGELPNYIGQELYALVDRQDDSMVTFMSLDYGTTFTVESCRKPSASESQIASGSSVLADEIAKIRTHARAIGDELKDLTSEFGNPRRQLLEEIRAEIDAPVSRLATSPTIVSRGTMEISDDSKTETPAPLRQPCMPELAASGNRMERQRGEIQKAREQQKVQNRRAQRLMRETGIYTPASARQNIEAEDAQFLANYLSNNSQGENAPQDGKVEYQLKPFGSAKRQYVDYLLNQLTDFRRSGESFGQKFTKPINFDMTRNIAQSQLKCSVYDDAKFSEVCTYLKAKIDGTILGKRNKASSISNYHSFEQNNEKAGTK